MSNKTFNSCQLCLYCYGLDFCIFSTNLRRPQHSASEDADLLSPECSDHGFLKNVMSLNKELLSPVAGLPSLARFYNLAGLTGNPVSVTQDLQLLICLNQRLREQTATSEREIRSLWSLHQLRSLLAEYLSNICFTMHEYSQETLLLACDFQLHYTEFTF